MLSCRAMGRHFTCSGARALSTSTNPSPFPFAYFYNDVYKMDLPEKHKFPMEKYGKVRYRLQERLRVDGVAYTSTDPKDITRPAKEAADGSPSVHAEFRLSPLATVEELQTTHCPKYIERFIHGDLTAAEVRAVGFPWSEQGVKRSLSSVGGTLAATRHVLSTAATLQKQGRTGPVVAAHLAGGTHHAFYDRGEGFCVFSDIAVATNCALREFPWVKQVLIIDLDVHQGNGNALLFAKCPQVYTFNMHGKGNVFSEMQVSDTDVELPNGCTGEEYLQHLAHWLPFLFSTLKPQLVFFQAGVDVLKTDRLGKLALTRKDIRRRNGMVYQAAYAHKAALVVTMGGGYPTDLDESSAAYLDTIDAHVDVYHQAVTSYGAGKGHSDTE